LGEEVVFAVVVVVILAVDDSKDPADKNGREGTTAPPYLSSQRT
jgi:hypothetical protein